MAKQCERCRCDFEPNSNAQKYCKDCAYMITYWKRAKYRKLKREERIFECKAIRNKDGSIDFDREGKEVRHLLKYYGLR